MKRLDLADMSCLVEPWPPRPQTSTVIFIHGAVGSCDLWRGQMKYLSPLANCVAIDLPGHGKSPGPGRSTIEAYAMAILEFADAMELTHFVPCGHSMGGAIALSLLLDHAPRCQAGILMNTGAKLKVLPAIFDMVTANYRGFVEMFLGLGTSPNGDGEALLSVKSAAAQCDSEVALGDFRACDTFDVMSRIHEIQSTVLIVTAEEDQLTPPKYGSYLREQIRHSRQCHIEKAGHLAFLERADLVNEPIARFLTETVL